MYVRSQKPEMLGEKGRQGEQGNQREQGQILVVLEAHCSPELEPELGGLSWPVILRFRTCRAPD